MCFQDYARKIVYARHANHALAILRQALPDDDVTVYEYQVLASLVACCFDHPTRAMFS